MTISSQTLPSLKKKKKKCYIRIWRSLLRRHNDERERTLDIISCKTTSLGFKSITPALKRSWGYVFQIDTVINTSVHHDQGAQNFSTSQLSLEVVHATTITIPEERCRVQQQNQFFGLFQISHPRFLGPNYRWQAIDKWQKEGGTINI